nr:aldehyde dehydrogenase family protein [Glaciibacter superstes]
MPATATCAPDSWTDALHREGQRRERLVSGGRPHDVERGWFVEPTAFADVDNRSTIAREEIFGPALSVIPYGDEDEAIRLANASSFGLVGRCGRRTMAAVSRSREGSRPAP